MNTVYWKVKQNLRMRDITLYVKKSSILKIA